MIAPELVSLGILAGGRASRLGGVDKAVLELCGETLLARTLRAFPEPFAGRFLSYNREPDFPVAGLHIVRDLRSGQLGPLAALESLFHACKTPWLLTAPVDIRDWPLGLAADLFGRVEEGMAGCTLSDADGLQPLVGLWKVAALGPSISAALDTGERAAHRWIAANSLPVHDISPWRLGNLNTAADFEIGTG